MTKKNLKTKKMEMETVPFICYESLKKFPLIFIIYSYRLLCSLMYIPPYLNFHSVIKK